jgi:hypothetical protein
MDERLMKKCIGAPIPEWDMAHRLFISRPAGPEIKDLGTIFCVNSAFMDVIEPSFLERQWVILPVVIAFVAIGIGPYLYWLTNIVYPYAGGVLGNIFAAFISFIFGSLVLKLGSGLFLGLRYQPIRFHRETRRLYAIRARRFFAKAGEGDVVWEAPWTDDSIFCLHREDSPFGTVFHIRHYTVDDRGNVTRVFSIGREWSGVAQIRLALAQWNYWCTYMNDGPSKLPKPMLFHTRCETPRESFLFSLYSFGMSAPVFMRMLAMPAVLVFTAMRMLANATCRDPIWPAAVEKISAIDANDPYAEPRAGTPVGWAETVLAQRRGEYPEDANARVDEWGGEPDARLHASAWLDNPTTHAAR